MTKQSPEFNAHFCNDELQVTNKVRGTKNEVGINDELKGDVIPMLLTTLIEIVIARSGWEVCMHDEAISRIQRTLL